MKKLYTQGTAYCKAHLEKLQQYHQQKAWNGCRLSHHPILWVVQSVSVPTLRDGCLSAMSRCPVIFFFFPPFWMVNRNQSYGLVNFPSWNRSSEFSPSLCIEDKLVLFNLVFHFLPFLILFFCSWWQRLLMYMRNIKKSCSFDSWALQNLAVNIQGVSTPSCLPSPFGGNYSSKESRNDLAKSLVS